MRRSVPVRQQKQGGGVYLLHFTSSLGNGNHHALHYVGWAKTSIFNRVQQHKRGSSYSAAITRAAVKAGIKIIVARIWLDETRAFERNLKNQKNHSRHCPICRAKKITQAALNSPKE